MLDDDVKQKALDLIPVIIETENLNSTITTDSETDEPFLIIEDWDEIAVLQRELNKWCSPTAFFQNKDRYIREQGKDAFKHMRFEVGHQYLIPDGLFELDDVIDNGFSDEYVTCYDCYRAICTTPGYYGDIPRYWMNDSEIICGDCVANDHEDEYIEWNTNHPDRAIKTTIISEDRLVELGWKQLKRQYENGMHHGQNDKPINVYNKLKKKYDVLFTFETGQFDVMFWAWIKKPASDDAG